jgi:hypothetical protein
LKQAKQIATSTQKIGKAGSSFDGRVFNTNKSYQYKIRVTWFTPDVIRATARYAQLQSNSPPDYAKSCVSEAEKAGDTIFLVEMKGREGSGVIPSDWEIFLSPKMPDHEKGITVTGTKNQDLRNLKALNRIEGKDYSYDSFWIVFSLVDTDGHSILPASATECELTIRIDNKEEIISWPIPESIRKRVESLVPKK